MSRAENIHQQFISQVLNLQLPQITDQQTVLTAEELVDIYESQMMSRLLDIVSRRLAKRRESFYTIGSSGHEGNAALGKVFSIKDIAFLHYRSGAMMIQRSKQLPGSTPLFDALLSFTASKEDPISGGRHKVLGSKPLNIPPQTSTIASHLPKAMGAAHALGLYPKIPHLDVGLENDSIILCSFGDASFNHSTAQGAMNTAAWAAYQQSPMPIVFICEDNGIGISTATPKQWIKRNIQHKPGIEYIACDGLNIIDSYSACLVAERIARKKRKPVFLHMRTVRLMGHAGSDTETAYLNKHEIEQNEGLDPLLFTAKILVQKNIMSPDNIVAMYCSLEQRIEAIAEVAIRRDKLSTAEEIKNSIWPNKNLPNIPLVPEKQRRQLFSQDQRFFNRKLPLAKHINLALADIMLQYPNTVVFGEDIAQKGGVYGVTQGLLEKFGRQRVINTILDEQSILGLAIGLAQTGYLPIAEIQYLAYVHNAEDQIRGEASSLAFFSQGQFTNPMVIRIAGLAYQKGFGGHFHNDNAFTVFRDIPGIILACPSNGADAASMLSTCVELAYREHKVVIFLEPIALYHTADLHQEGDNAWSTNYLAPSQRNNITYGEPGVHGDLEQCDVCIISYANGYYLSRQAAKILQREYKIRIRILDLRWLHPLPEKQILQHSQHCNNILIVDECRKSGSVSEALVALLYEDNTAAKISRIHAEDCFIPLGDAAYKVLPEVTQIVEHILQILPAEKKHPAPQNLKIAGGDA